MNRRQFLLTSSAAAAAGCGLGQQAPPAAVTTLFTAQAERWCNWVIALKRFRVPATAVRTTPPPPLVVPDVFPPLKPLIKFAVRLHPRFGDEPAADATKVGGRFAWPAGEPHPPGFVPVLQLRVEDAPPQFAFPPDADLMQLMWDADLRTRTFWRKRAGCTGPSPDPMPIPVFPADLLPIPCVAFPEKVAEYPSPDLMPKQMRERIEAWSPPGGSGEPGPRFFADRLASAPGIKIGGWPRWAGTPSEPACLTCKRLMDYLLTVASNEWDDRTRPRWMPTEEQGITDVEGYRAATGLRLGPDGRGGVHVFICRRCEGWPVAGVVG